VPDLDQFFLLNLIADALLLWALARVRGQALSLRVPLAALLGALYATAAMLPGFAWLGGLPGEVGAAALMVAIVRRPHGWRPLLVDCGVLMLLAAALAGLALLASGVVGSGGASGHVAALCAAAVLFWLACEGFVRWQRAGAQSGSVRDLRVQLLGRSVALPALVDTGLQMRDPLTGTPVVIVELAALRRVLPRELGAALARPALAASAEVAAAAAADDRVACALRLMQLRTVGSDAEWLFGLRARARAGRAAPQDVVLCLTPRRLSPNGAFVALMPLKMCVLGEGVVS